MIVKLWVNWRGREVLTNQQLEEKINARVEEVIANDDSYNECLEEYIDSNYTKLELFDALVNGDATIKETIDDIKSGVAEGIADWCDMNIRGDYEEVKIEV